jgi:hypothetical protein
MTAAQNDRLRNLINELLVERLHTRTKAKSRDHVEKQYVETQVSSVRLDTVQRKIAQLSADMLRTGAAEGAQAQALAVNQLREYRLYAEHLRARYGL